MPELPEVETVCRGLEKPMLGKVIAGVIKNRAGLRIPFPKNLQDIAAQKVIRIERRAKYILVHLSKGLTLIVHLGMTGRMTQVLPAEKYLPEKHDHMVITLADHTKIILNDARRFGLVDIAITENLPQHRFFKNLGPEPLTKDFTAEYLRDTLHNKKVAIKLAIMDQQVVVGVGNIYASEALFLAGINPTREANKLTLPQLKKLVSAIQTVLKAAIRAGGSSLRDYVQADGELGFYQNQFAVYDKMGEKCQGCTCKMGSIQRITQGGRSTFYCTTKQK